MKFFRNKLMIFSVMLLCITVGCDDFLDESPESQMEAETIFKDLATAEIGITGCYNKFFDQNAYSSIIMTIQVSTDDVSANATTGSQFLYENRANLKSINALPGPWIAMYRAIANVNYLLEEVEKLPESAFGTTPERKTQILAEAHFIRAAAYYYLSISYGDVPLITSFVENISESLVGKTPRAEVVEFVEEEFELAEAGLPDVVTGYKSASTTVTDLVRGRASKWAAKAYLARLALQKNDWQRALDLSNQIIDSKLYPFTTVWRLIFQHPMNASESILEQQNDFSPGFFGSGVYGWPFLNTFAWTEEAKNIFEAPVDPFTQQGMDVRFSLPYAPYPNPVNDATKKSPPRPNKYLPVRGFADGGVESSNFTIIRLSELLFNRAEALNELDFAANRAEVIDILNMMRARAEDATFDNLFIPTAPDGTTGITPLVAEDFATQEQLRAAIRSEKRRELMFEDVIRWVDLYRWDREYLKTMVNAPTEDHLFWPIPNDEIVRNAQLEQNPAYK